MHIKYMYIFQGLTHKNTRDSGDIIKDDGGGVLDVVGGWDRQLG